MAKEEVWQEAPPHFVTEIAELWPPQGKWTEADYFALPETNRFIELSEGRLITPPHPTHTHQRTVGALYRAFYSFVEAHDLGIVQLAPLPVRLGPNTIREPDVLFVAHQHADRIGEQAYGPPDLVVEVISPSTRQTDRVEKFAEYARAGISEYWLVDPETRTIEVFILRNGTYELLVKAGPGEKARSQLLSGFEVAVDEVFA
ncbi:MAG: Uma2 family endonuclease [Acidobacteria bacterium]|nr:MAG: Uma2 family endonuclease [Acidobacteriota bacterium]